MEPEKFRSLHNSIMRFHNTIDSISISPMGNNFGRYSYNLRIGFKSERIDEIMELGWAKWCETEPSDSRLIRVKRNYDNIFNKIFWKGCDGFTAHSATEYAFNANFISSWIKQTFKKIKVDLYDISFNIVQNVSFYNAQKIDFDVYVKKKIHESEINRHNFYDEKITDIESLIRYVNKDVKSIYNIVSIFIDNCDSAYNKNVIGKIRAGTSITPNELDAYETFKSAYKELIKIKSFVRTSNTLIKDIK